MRLLNRALPLATLAALLTIILASRNAFAVATCGGSYTRTGTQTVLMYNEVTRQNGWWSTFATYKSPSGRHCHANITLQLEYTGNIYFPMNAAGEPLWESSMTTGGVCTWQDSAPHHIVSCDWADVPPLATVKITIVYFGAALGVTANSTMYWSVNEGAYPWDGSFFNMAAGNVNVH